MERCYLCGGKADMCIVNMIRDIALDTSKSSGFSLGSKEQPSCEGECQPQQGSTSKQKIFTFYKYGIKKKEEYYSLHSTLLSLSHKKQTV